MMITKWLQLWDSPDSVARKNDSSGFHFTSESLYSVFKKSERKLQCSCYRYTSMNYVLS